MMNTTVDRKLPRLFRSVFAVLAPLAGVIAVTIATDQVFHSLGVYPPWGQPMPEPGDNLLALSYRIPFAVLSGYASARLAPRAPTSHVVALGLLTIGLTLGGTAAAEAKMGDLGPDWFWIALAATALPCTLLGARLAPTVRRGR